MVTLIGMGSGSWETLSVQAQDAVRRAGLVFGAKRLLAGLPPECTARQFALYQPAEILETLAQAPGQDAAVLYSGDTGFYSGASGLLTPLRALGIPARVYPGVSSIQLLAAALGRPWQDWKLVSAHGCACDPVAQCMTERSVFFLTGGAETPATLCRKLADAGMGEAHALVGENLGTGEEAIRYGSAAELAGQSFAPLSVLLVENFDVPHFRAPGFPDESFIRGQVPMTKQEVRAAALAKLAVKPADILWDVGAGTGSVSVELALAAPKGVRSGRLCPDPAEPGKVPNLQPHPHRGPRPGCTGRPACAGRRVHWRNERRHGGRAGCRACQKPGRAHLHFRHCAGNAELCGCRPYRPGPCCRGGAAGGQPHKAGRPSSPAHGK